MKLFVHNEPEDDRLRYEEGSFALRASVCRGNTVAARDAAAAAHMLVEVELSNAEATLTKLKIAWEAAHGGIVKVQGDIAVMMRENEEQQQLLREMQAQKEAVEAALSGEGLRQLQAEID